MTYILKKEQIADVFTKELLQSNFDDFIHKDIINIYDQLREEVLRSQIMRDLIL